MEGGGLGASEIVNSLYSRDFILRTLGNVEVDYSTIAVSYNAVVCRARIDGYDGAILLKCYCRHLCGAREVYGELLRRDELGIALYNGDIHFSDVVAMPWVDGTPLNVVLNYIDADYALLGRKFELFAHNILNDGTTHGDISPMNIIVDENGDMRLIDFDTVAPTPLLAQYAEICRHRLLDNTSDDYALAAIATTLERLTFDEGMFGCYLQEDGTLDVPFLK